MSPSPSYLLYTPRSLFLLLSYKLPLFLLPTEQKMTHFKSSQGCNPLYRKLVQGGVAVQWPASAALTLAFCHRLSRQLLWDMQGKNPNANAKATHSLGFETLCPIHQARLKGEGNVSAYDRRMEEPSLMHKTVDFTWAWGVDNSACQDLWLLFSSLGDITNPSIWQIQSSPVDRKRSLCRPAVNYITWREKLS